MTDNIKVKYFQLGKDTRGSYQPDDLLREDIEKVQINKWLISSKVKKLSKLARVSKYSGLER